MNGGGTCAVDLRSGKPRGAARAGQRGCGRGPGSEVSRLRADCRQLGCGVCAGWEGVFGVRTLYSVDSDSS